LCERRESRGVHPKKGKIQFKGGIVNTQKTEKGKAAATTLPRTGNKAGQLTPRQIVQVENIIVKKLLEKFDKMTLRQFVELGIHKLPASSVNQLCKAKEREAFLRPVVKEMVRKNIDNLDLSKLI